MSAIEINRFFSLNKSHRKSKSQKSVSKRRRINSAPQLVVSQILGWWSSGIRLGWRDLAPNSNSIKPYFDKASMGLTVKSKIVYIQGLSGVVMVTVFPLFSCFFSQS